MQLAEKLQRLRKARGLSQEQLAEHIGVSRQAVSKWESAQAMPDVDKVVQLSEFYGVSTDYLLKDKVEERDEAASAAEPGACSTVPGKTKPDALLFVPVATALNGIGLLAAMAVWYLFGQWGDIGLLASAAGVAVMLVGCAVFAVGQIISQTPATRLLARRLFWALNGGLLCYLPLVHLFNRVWLGWEYPFVSYRYAPLPVAVWISSDPGRIHIWPRWLFWVLFAAVCVGFAMCNLRRLGEGKNTKS